MSTIYGGDGNDTIKNFANNVFRSVAARVPTLLKTAA